MRNSAISDRQLAFINWTAENRGWTDKDVETESVRLFGEPLRRLTRSQGRELCQQALKWEKKK